MNTTLVSWAFALIMTKAPPAPIVAANHAWDLGETVEQRIERYHEIAEAAVDVGQDKSTIALILDVDIHESGLSRDTDLGPTCYRGVDGKNSRCDSGRAACGMQVRTDIHRKWKSADLFADRRACFRAGLELLRASMKKCLSLGPDHVFDAYAGGLCMDGTEISTKSWRDHSLQIYNLWMDYRGFKVP